LKPLSSDVFYNTKIIINAVRHNGRGERRKEKGERRKEKGERRNLVKTFSQGQIYYSVCVSVL